MTNQDIDKCMCTYKRAYEMAKAFSGCTNDLKVLVGQEPNPDPEHPCMDCVSCPDTRLNRKKEPHPYIKELPGDREL